MNAERSLVSMIRSFASKKILVVGDLILDVYLKGVSTRLSPEAPVPVVDVTEKIVVLGGAANTAYNLAVLGASVLFCTVIGNDAEGDLALSLLSEHENINTDLIVRCNERQTICKTRVIAGTHVITRIDTGCTTDVDETSTKLLSHHLVDQYKNADAIIISDYNKGLINQDIITLIENLQCQYHKVITIDSKRLSTFHRLAPSIVKPNYDEAIRLLNLLPQFEDRADQLKSCHGLLHQKTNAKIIAITMDSEGSLLFSERADPIHVSAPCIDSPHIAGAGDTYASAFTLAYTAGADISECGEIATAAASVSINKELTAACSNHELVSYFTSKAKYIFDENDLYEICKNYHLAGKRLVFTNGCFDILHSGHVSYLHKAKALGDILIVGVNNDESIKRLKGAHRPINPLSDRLEVLAGLSAVDHLISFGSADDDTPISLINVVKPQVFAKGGDYTRDKLPEADHVEKAGGKIVFLPHVADRSTTRIIDKINKNITVENLSFN
jgi:D-beta-D-heptose 7-phosphate kinase/D-beta-D-heptose 1-phosphate adenosyltransferase